MKPKNFATKYILMKAKVRRDCSDLAYAVTALPTGAIALRTFQLSFSKQKVGFNDEPVK